MRKFIAILAPDAGALTTQYALARRAEQLLLLPGLRRLVRNEVTQEVRRDHASAAAQSVAAVEEVWVETDDPGTLTALLRQADAGLVVMQATEVRDALIYQREAQGRAPLKRLSLLKRLPLLSSAAFSAYWAHVHAPLARIHRHVCLYRQNHVVTAPLESTVFDGVAEFRITDLDGMQEDYASAEGRRMSADTANFAAAVSTYLVREQVFAKGSDTADNDILVLQASS